MDIALHKEGNALSASLLITGCCIGAGMVGLPVMSAMAGFLPSTLAMLLCYLFSTGTGLLILEATLLFDQRVNLISMARFALGRIGATATWMLFLFLFYSLFVAYIDGGGRLISSLLSHLMHYSIPPEVGIISCVAFVGTVAFSGTRIVSLVSTLFLSGMAVSYGSLIASGLPYVNHDKLLYLNFKGALSTLPILLVCFGYQNLIPTLTYYVRKNISAMRTAIFVGNLISFLIYFLWNYVILGILPDSATMHASDQSDMVTGLLESVSTSTTILVFANTFAFFAILTPFIANAMSFIDFLRDGLQLSKKVKHDLLICCLIFGPPTLLTFLYPHFFLDALRFAGGFADVILFGIIPVLIVWNGRYILKMESPYTVGGGKAFLILILLLCLTFLCIK